MVSTPRKKQSQQGLEDLRQTFRQIWGYDDFRPPQGEIASAILQGQDIVVVLPTGGGKSIETMVTREALVRELNGLSFLHLLELEREVFEGKYHTGLSAVVQLIGAKLD